MRRKDGHENHDRWLITYADLITLLLIFFVIMYAMSKIDISKYGILADSLQLQFSNADSILPTGSSFIGPATPSNKKEKENQDNELAELKKQEHQLQNLLKVINEYIDLKQLQGKISVSDTPRGIAITLNDLLLFDVGDAELKAPAKPILEKLASLFPKLDAAVSIEGHTDDLPVAAGSAFQDNWGLSSARSLSVLRYFMDTAHLDADRFVIAGYADTKPVASDKTVEGRQQNRRVEIVVLRLAE